MVWFDLVWFFGLAVMKVLVEAVAVMVAMTVAEMRNNKLYIL